MANLAQVMKDEIQRIARKEMKQGMEALREENAQLKKSVAEQSRRITQLEQGKAAAPKSAPAGKAKAATAPITSDEVRALRERLGMSQAALAEKLGVNAQSVYQWEHKGGALSFRGATEPKLRKLMQRASTPAPAKGKPGRKPAKASGGKKQTDAGGGFTSASILALRKRLGLTQGQMAEAVGVNPQSIYQWEHKGGALTFRRGDTEEKLRKLAGSEAATEAAPKAKPGRKPKAAAEPKKRGPKPKQAAAAAEPKKRGRKPKQAAAATEPKKRGRKPAALTSADVIALRERLDLTQAQLGELVGVNPQSIYQWERKGGVINFRRGETEATLRAVTGLGKRAAHRRLAE